MTHSKDFKGTLPTLSCFVHSVHWDNRSNILWRSPPHEHFYNLSNAI